MNCNSFRNSRTSRPQRGFSLIEQLLVLALLAVVTGIAVSLMASTERVRNSVIPGANLVWTRARVLADLSRAETAAANLAYFDSAATIEAAYEQASGGRSRLAPQPGTPPSGFCGPVDVRAPSTWPPGFDPRDPGTFELVEWWQGFTRNDPATWYYQCQTTPPAPGPGTGRLVPVYSFGTGVAVSGAGGWGGPGPGTGGGNEFRILGPAGVASEAAALFPDQEGDALVLVNTEPAFGPLALGATFSSGSGVIRFVARDRSTRDRVESLRAKDVLIITGRSAGGGYATAIAQLTDAPSRIAIPGPANDTNEAIFGYFEAPVLPAASRFLWGLRSSPETRAGAVIESDASVALLDRRAAVVTYYTARDDAGSLTLVKVLGDPSAPESREVLVRNVRQALDAGLTMISIGPAGRVQSVAASLSVALSVSGKDGPEPVNVRVLFLGGAQTNRHAGLLFGQIRTGVDTEFPDPPIAGDDPPGHGAGGSDE